MNLESCAPSSRSFRDERADALVPVIEMNWDRTPNSERLPRSICIDICLVTREYIHNVYIFIGLLYDKLCYYLF